MNKDKNKADRFLSMMSGIALANQLRELDNAIANILEKGSTKKKLSKEKLKRRKKNKAARKARRKNRK